MQLKQIKELYYPSNILIQALLYHTFAAMAGDTRSEMTVAYRHLMGIGTPRSCEDAVLHYKSVADKCTLPTTI
jgi:TPR repeat protein